jgi:hypothetical protein
MNRICILSVSALVLFAAPAQAKQTDSSRVNDRVGKSGAEAWVGYSKGSTRLGVLGLHDGLRLGLAAVRYNRRVHTRHDRSIYYTVDLIPVATLSSPVEYGTVATSQGFTMADCSRGPYDCQRDSSVAYGFGANPIGFTAVYHPDRNVQWLLGATGGAMWFDRRVPTNLSTKFNFTATGEAGVQLVNHRGRGVLLVYRLHHLSNAGRGYDNRAMLSHVFSAGLRWR